MLSIALSAVFAAQVDAPAPVQNATQKPKLVCRSQKVTGSRLQQRRICATSRQWELVDKEIQDAVRDSQSQSNGPGAMDEAMSGDPG